MNYIIKWHSGKEIYFDSMPEAIEFLKHTQPEYSITKTITDACVILYNPKLDKDKDIRVMSCEYYITELKSKIVQTMKEREEWRDGWYEQRIATGNSFWNGYEAAIQRNEKFLKNFPYRF